MCLTHNARRVRAPLAPAWVLDALATVHNLALVVFSAAVFVVATYYFAGHLHATGGLHNFLCKPPPSAAAAADGSNSFRQSRSARDLAAATAAAAVALPPLAGHVHYWCYIFYLSKYWELVDTMLLISLG